MHKNKCIFWCTGISGVGKSTLASYASMELKKNGYKTLIIDGDSVRDNYKNQLGFGRSDVEKNNLNIAEKCKIERDNYDAIFVPVISPIEIVRQTIREILSPEYYLIYIEADIESLKKRDPKGLYKKADNGELHDLIGYSKNNKYDIPIENDLEINTTRKEDLNVSKEQFSRFVLKKMVEASISSVS
jgi:adenylylsulfate kinase-like enzyme